MILPLAAPRLEASLSCVSVSDQLQGSLAETKSAKEAWETLKDMFDMQTTAGRMVVLADLANLRPRPNESIAAYVYRGTICQVGQHNHPTSSLHMKAYAEYPVTGALDPRPTKSAPGLLFQ